MTLNDTVTYNEKHNDANGEDNKDGSDDNRSWNCGVEGPTDDADVNALRARQIRNVLATLLLSQGTPMLLAGDEFGRTQDGNNNAYCQDSEISWLNWDIEEKGEALIGFTKRLLQLRRDHPVIRSTRFRHGRPSGELEVKDVTWINAGGGEMDDGDWSDGNLRCFGMLLDGRAKIGTVREAGDDEALLIVVNGWEDGVAFTLPDHPAIGGWCLLTDTNAPDEAGDFAIGDSYTATGRSVIVFRATAS